MWQSVVAALKCFGEVNHEESFEEDQRRFSGTGHDRQSDSDDRLHGAR